LATTDAFLKRSTANRSPAMSHREAPSCNGSLKESQKLQQQGDLAVLHRVQGTTKMQQRFEHLARVTSGRKATTYAVARYRDAAEYMAQWFDIGACEAIANCSSDIQDYDEETHMPYVSELIDAFSEIFRPIGKRWDSYWIGDLTEENQNTRVLALLLMAELVEDEQ
jgi:hypothetical protein